jgi:hypothetical protein
VSKTKDPTDEKHGSRAEEDRDGTRLEQQRRKARLTTQLRANLKRRKLGHATAKGGSKVEASEN